MFYYEKMSKLKRKLLLYFIVVAVVSFSVSGEMILQVSSPRFQQQIIDNFQEELLGQVSEIDISRQVNNIERDQVFLPLKQLRERILLLMAFIAGSIILSLTLFIREIIAPLEDIVATTKRLSEGDLTAVAHVRSNDEIGQIAAMLNNMNENFVSLLIQLRYEMSHQTVELEKFLMDSYDSEIASLQRSMKDNHCDKQSDFNEVMDREKMLLAVIERQLGRIEAVTQFINSYQVTKNSNNLESY